MDPPASGASAPIFTFDAGYDGNSRYLPTTTSPRVALSLQVDKREIHELTLVLGSLSRSMSTATGAPYTRAYHSRRCVSTARDQLTRPT